MPKLFSLGFLLTVIGSVYVGNTVWTFYHIYFPPWCTVKKADQSIQCLGPKFLCNATDIVFQGWLSTSRSPSKSNAIKIFSKQTACGESWQETFNGNLASIVNPNSAATFYLHVLAMPVQNGRNGNLDFDFGSANVVHQRVNMSKMLEEELTAINLITSAPSPNDNQSVKRSYSKILHWNSKVRLHVMETQIIFDRNSLPHEIFQLLKVRQESSGIFKYLPLLFIDSLSSKREDYLPLKNATSLNLTIDYTPISVGKIRLISMMGSSFEQMKSFGLQESDLEDVVAIFTETNFYILTLTIVVTVLHLAFDFLAFKNDISFWRKKNTTVGLSGRTILWRAFSQIIVFLYLLEEKSSLLISIPAGIACLIEIWKVLKLWKFRGFERSGWRIQARFDTISAAERNSDNMDAHFVRKLSYLLLPLCLAGAVYSLFYVPHKSWYSWTIQSAVNGVYAFGFLFMIPQLYLNYKLKSVAHLPWKVFSYKALNTFIDDLFAFIVKMPLAHRLACFRDDIVFIFYLLQLYLYPVDKSRANEFGQSFENENIEMDKSDAKKTN